MSKILYVGNLPYSVDEQSLTDKFSECGSVHSARVITDRDSGRSKGFAFVEMSTDAEAASAIEKFNGADMDGRAMNVTEAKPKAPREERGGGGGYGGGGGGGRGRDGGGYGGGGGRGGGGRY